MIKESISFEDFQKIDIRIGTIIQVDTFPNAKVPAYQILINFGALGVKKTSAQITSLYTRKELMNKKVIAVINFEPKQIANFISECLILGIQNEKDVVLLQSHKDALNGAKVS